MTKMLKSIENDLTEIKKDVLELLDDARDDCQHHNLKRIEDKIHHIWHKLKTVREDFIQSKDDYILQEHYADLEKDYADLQAERDEAELQHAMKGRKEFRILVMHNAEFIREILYPTMVDG